MTRFGIVCISLCLSTHNTRFDLAANFVLSSSFRIDPSPPPQFEYQRIIYSLLLLFGQK